MRLGRDVSRITFHQAAESLGIDIASLVAHFASGSNAYAQKFMGTIRRSAAARTFAAWIRVSVAEVDSVYAGHVSHLGMVPATLHGVRGATAPGSVVLLEAASQPALDKWEGRGSLYRLGLLGPRHVFEYGLPGSRRYLHNVAAYIDPLRYEPSGPGHGPHALEAVPAIDSHLPRSSCVEIMTNLRSGLKELEQWQEPLMVSSSRERARILATTIQRDPAYSAVADEYLARHSTDSLGGLDVHFLDDDEQPPSVIERNTA